MEALGKSIFNYKEYSIYRFIHYYQQIEFLLKIKPKKVLEIGPGDYTITDFLRRKGIKTKTFDNDTNLKPDYFGDIRSTLEIPEEFDLILASEVFEHMNVKWLPTILKNLKKIMHKNSYLLVSLPYTTIRFFSGKKKDKFLTCEGIIYTRLPVWFYHIYLNIIKHPIQVIKYCLYSIIRKKKIPSIKDFLSLPNYPDNRLDTHHWDLGWYQTRVSIVREIFLKFFNIIIERKYIDTNCVFWLLKKKNV